MSVLNTTITEDLGNTTLVTSLDDETSETYNCTENGTEVVRKGTNLAEIPAKEIIIVVLMLGLWAYSIMLTRKAWYRILKE